MSCRSARARLIALASLAVAIGSCTEMSGPGTLQPPTNVTVTMLTPRTARVSWTASADAQLVTSYKVFRDGTLVGETAGTSFVDAGLVEAVTYKYRVSANGVQGLFSDLSAESAAASVTVPDVTPPSITSFSPPSGATGVSLSTTMDAAFSEAIDPSSVNSTTFIVTTAGGGAVAGSVSYIAASRTAEFKASGSLPNAATLFATITTGIRDVAGNHLAAEYKSSFSTRDEIPPTVTSVSPISGASGVPASATVVVTFSKPMDPSTLSSSSFSLKTASGGASVAGSVAYQSGTNTAVFTPSAALAFGVGYTASVSTSVKDLAGNSLATVFAWSFSTASAPDLTPPTVISTSPVPGAVGVGVTATVTATFSEPMLGSSVDGFSVTLRATSSGAPVVGSVSYNPATNTASFSPSAPLAGNASYTATITTGARDVAGNALAAAYVWSYTTLDNNPPVVISVSPASGATGAGVGTSVTITFSKAMDPSTVSNSAISLTNNSTLATVPGIVGYSAESNTATFAPSSALSFATSYTINVSTGVRDTAGNAMASAFSSGFATAAQGDVTPPTVIATVPANGATNVSVGTFVGVTFSEPIDATTITSSSLKLIVTSTGAQVAGSVGYNPANNTGVFSPFPQLNTNTGYTIVVGTGVRDLAGNALASMFTSGFTTAPPPDNTPPNVISVSPPNSGVGVFLTSAMTVTFSEPMNPATINSSTVIVRNVSENFVLSGSLTYDTGSNTATFTPSGTLAYDEKYSIAVTAGATDVAGNGLAPAFSSGFNTIQQVSNQPYFQGTDAGDNFHLHITFAQSGRTITLGSPCPGLPQAYCEMFALNAGAGTDIVGPATPGENGGSLVTSVTGTFNDPNITFTFTLQNGRSFTYTGTVTTSSKMVGTLSGASLPTTSLTLVR